MTGNKQELIRYRIARAYETLEDAQILAEQKRWNSSINRLYYAAYYGVMALLLADDLFPATHNGAKSNFNQYFISTNRIDKSFGKIYSQLFTWRQKGDYDDLFDFDEEKVAPYFKPVKDLIQTIDEEIYLQEMSYHFFGQKTAFLALTVLRTRSLMERSKSSFGRKSMVGGKIRLFGPASGLNRFGVYVAT